MNTICHKSTENIVLKRSVIPRTRQWEWSAQAASNKGCTTVENIKTVIKLTKRQSAFLFAVVNENSDHDKVLHPEKYI